MRYPTVTAASRVAALVATISATFLATACTGPDAPENVLLGAANSVHEGMLGWRNITDDTVRLATTGVVDVDVELFAGAVRVVTDPSAKVTTVGVRRTGTHGWLRGDESMDSLGEIRYTVSLARDASAANGGRERAVIRAGTDHAEPHFQAVDVVITVPDLGTVRVMTQRGDVWIEGNRGGVEVISSRAAIRVMTPWKIDAPISLVTSDGDIDLRLRGESTGAVDAATVGGVVKTRIKYGKWVATDSANDADSIRATMNDGTNPITMRTSNANVMLSVVPMPVSQNPAPAIW
jgi:Putative adhesin